MEQLFNLFGIAVQAGGIALLALLTASLCRSIDRTYLRYWAAAWTAMAIALGMLFVSFHAGRLGRVAQFVYFLGEYVFGFLLIAGCRNLRNGMEPDLLAQWRWMLAACACAVVLAVLPPDFTLRFGPQALIMAAIFGLAFSRLRPIPRARQRRLGIRVARMALAGMAALFALHGGMVLVTVAMQTAEPFFYRAFLSIYDLVMEATLGFSLVMIATEDVREELERANARLARSRDGMERLAHTDSLTGAFNRRAFESMVEEWRERSAGGGVAAVVDLDNLKWINDGMGHAAGDAAILAVAQALAGSLRRDDRVFRWGGDEFLCVLLGMSEAEVRARFQQLGERLGAVMLHGGTAPARVEVSVGVAAFRTVALIDAAIAAADADMYRIKSARKAARRVAEAAVTAGTTFIQ
jgi:diguanylate cyclase (GGDEF)-like protein